MREMRGKMQEEDQLSRIEEKVDRILVASTENRTTLKGTVKRVDAHDTRISKLEKWVYMALGASGVIEIAFEIWRMK